MPKVPSFLKFRTSYDGPGRDPIPVKVTASRMALQTLDKSRGVDALAQDLESVWQRVAKLLNGGISFGDGTQSDNVNGVWVNIVTPNVANTDFVVTHNLGRVPAGYIVKSKSAPTDIYDGSVAASETQLTLRATAINVSVRLFIL